MLDKHFLESFLNVNASSAGMSQGEVRAVLERAGWPSHEIDAGLALLQGSNDPDTVASLQGERKVAFRPDMEFSSQDLSKLLGVDVVIDPSRLNSDAMVMQESPLRALFFGTLSVVAVVLLAVGTALGIALCFAHFLNIDLFGV